MKTLICLVISDIREFFSDYLLYQREIFATVKIEELND